MALRRALLALVLAVVAHAADGVPRFNATMTLGGHRRFVLISAAGKVSGWLQLGDTFDGYKLKFFDQNAAAIVLERAGETMRVAIMADAPVKPVGEATSAENRRVLERFVIKIPANGALSIKGQRALVVGNRQLAPDARFAVRYQEVDHLLELVAAGESDFTVRFRSEEFTYPIRPAK